MSIPEGGYFQCPNMVVDKLYEQLSHAERSVAIAIIRVTLGWHTDKKPLAISYVAKVAKVAECTANETMLKLEAMGYLISHGTSPQGKIYEVRFEEPPAPAQAPCSADTSLPSRDIPPCSAGTYKDNNKNISTVTNVTGEASSPPSVDKHSKSLRARVLASIEASYLPYPLEDTPTSEDTTSREKGRRLTPQQQQVGIISQLWVYLFGKSSLPDAGAIVKLIKSYGGFRQAEAGASRLAVAMLKLAAQDIPGGPLNILFTNAKAKPQERQAPNYQAWERITEVTEAPVEEATASIEELRARFTKRTAAGPKRKTQARSETADATIELPF